MAAQRNKNHGDEIPEQSTSTVQGVAIHGKITVTASRTFKINLGNFENADVFHSVSYEVDPDADLEALSLQLSEQLDTLQTNDLNMAAEVGSERKSFIHKLLK